MPDSTSVSPNTDVGDDKKSVTDSQKMTPVQPVSKPKEQEPESADAALAEIQEREKEATKVAERELTETIGKEAKLKEPEPEIPPEVKEVGVKSPEKEASEILKKGATVDLAITEDTYKKGEQAKLDAKVTVKREVLGVASIIALAMYVGRMIKMAHHHAKKVVFKKGG